MYTYYHIQYSQYRQYSQRTRCHLRAHSPPLLAVCKTYHERAMPAEMQAPAPVVDAHSEPQHELQVEVHQDREPEP